MLSFARLELPDGFQSLSLPTRLIGDRRCEGCELRAYAWL